MSHARQQIRSAVVALLGLASKSWKAVFATRLPTSRAVMPYLMVFDTDEAIDTTGEASPVHFRTVTLIVAGRVRLPGNADTESVEDTLDDVADEIETTLTFAALQAEISQLQGLRLAATEKTVVINDDAAPQYGEVTLQFVVRYATQEGAPSVFL